MSRIFTFPFLVMVACLSACGQGEPVDMQIKGHLSGLGGRMSMFLDQEFDNLSQAIPMKIGTLVEVTNGFGRCLQRYAEETDMPCRFDEQHRLIDDRGQVVRVWIKVGHDKPGEASGEVRFVTYGKNHKEIVVVAPFTQYGPK